MDNRNVNNEYMSDNTMNKSVNNYNSDGLSNNNMNNGFYQRPNENKKQKKFLIMFIIGISVLIIATIALMLTSNDDRKVDNDNVLGNDSQKGNDTSLIDFFKGNTWVSESGSVIIFGNNNAYIWYKSVDSIDKDDNYYYGTYEILKGKNADNFAISTNNSVYNLLTKLYLPNYPETYIDTYVLSLSHQYLVQNGVHTNMNTTTHYYGRYYKDVYENFYSYKLNGDNSAFKIEKVTNNGDINE